MQHQSIFPPYPFPRQKTADHYAGLWLNEGKLLRRQIDGHGPDPAVAVARQPRLQQHGAVLQHEAAHDLAGGGVTDRIHLGDDTT